MTKRIAVLDMMEAADRSEYEDISNDKANRVTKEGDYAFTLFDGGEGGGNRADVVRIVEYEKVEPSFYSRPMC